MALSGPRVAARSGKAAQLVVMVHGYGADGNDLVGLAQPLSQLLPDAAFVAPDAPQPCAGARFQWFPIAELDPRALHKGVVSAAPALHAFVDGELKRLALTADHLAFIGFSQGTMIALHLGLGALKPAAIVGFSGMLTSPPAAREDWPPVFLAHGSDDPLIPPEALFVAAGTLGAMGTRVQWHLSPGIGHGIDDGALSRAGSFLKLAFAGRLAAHGPASSHLH